MCICHHRCIYPIHTLWKKSIVLYFVPTDRPPWQRYLSPWPWARSFITLRLRSLTHSIALVVLDLYLSKHCLEMPVSGVAWGIKLVHSSFTTLPTHTLNHTPTYTLCLFTARSYFTCVYCCMLYSNCVGDELWTCMFGDININIVAFKEKHNHPTTATPTLTSTLTVTSGCDHVAVGKTINPSSSSSTSSSSSSLRLRLRDDVEVVTAVGTVARAIAPLIFYNGQQTLLALILTCLTT